MAHGNKGFIILPMWVIAFVALWQYMGSTMMLLYGSDFRIVKGPL